MRTDRELLKLTARRTDSMKTLATICDIISALAPVRRGVMEEEMLFGIRVRVPIWRVGKAKKILHERLPFHMRAEVERLSFFEHLTCWSIKADSLPQRKETQEAP